MNDFWDSIVFWCTICLLAFCMLCLGIKLGATHVEQKAIEAGVAHYVVNEKTGETKFVFNTNKE